MVQTSFRNRGVKVVETSERPQKNKNALKGINISRPVDGHLPPRFRPDVRSVNWMFLFESRPFQRYRLEVSSTAKKAKVPPCGNFSIDADPFRTHPTGSAVTCFLSFHGGYLFLYDWEVVDCGGSLVYCAVRESRTAVVCGFQLPPSSSAYTQT